MSEIPSHYYREQPDPNNLEIISVTSNEQLQKLIKQKLELLRAYLPSIAEYLRVNEGDLSIDTKTVTMRALNGLINPHLAPDRRHYTLNSLPSGSEFYLKIIENNNAYKILATYKALIDIQHLPLHDDRFEID